VHDSHIANDTGCRFLVNHVFKEAICVNEVVSTYICTTSHSKNLGYGSSQFYLKLCLEFKMDKFTASFPFWYFGSRKT
jgi:hypothetical protein